MLYKKLPSASKKSFPTWTTGEVFSISRNSSSSSSVHTRPSQLSSCSCGCVSVSEIVSSSLDLAAEASRPVSPFVWVLGAASGTGARDPTLWSCSIKAWSATGAMDPSLRPGRSTAGVCFPVSFSRSSAVLAPEANTRWPSSADILASWLAFLSGGGTNLLRKTRRMTSGVTENPSARRSTVHSSGCSSFRYLQMNEWHFNWKPRKCLFERTMGAVLYRDAHLICSMALQVSFLWGAPEGVIRLLSMWNLTVCRLFLPSLETMGGGDMVKTMRTGTRLLFTAYETHSAKAWSLSSTSSKLEPSPVTPSSYTEALLEALPPTHGAPPLLLANLQPLVEAGGSTERTPTLEKTERTWRSRAIGRKSCCFFVSTQATIKHV